MYTLLGPACTVYEPRNQGLRHTLSVSVLQAATILVTIVVIKIIEKVTNLVSILSVGS